VSGTAAGGYNHPVTHVRAGRWGIVAAAGLLAAALWLRTDAVAALAMATVGSFAVAALAWRWRRTPAALTCALLLVAVSVAGWTDVGRRSRLATPAGADATRYAMAERATAAMA
jgi:hypothetical protein